MLSKVLERKSQFRHSTKAYCSTIPLQRSEKTVQEAAHTRKYLLNVGITTWGKNNKPYSFGDNQFSQRQESEIEVILVSKDRS